MTNKYEKIETMISYINCNKFIIALGIHFMFSTILFATTKIDICIPCIWKAIFNVNCLGCGLTSAFIYLLKLNFIDAYKSNPLIYIIIPFGIYYIKQDYQEFKNIKNRTTKNSR